MTLRILNMVRRRRINPSLMGRFALLAGLTVLASPAAASAAPTLHIVPQKGTVGNLDDGFLSDSRQPTFGLEGTGTVAGDKLECAPFDTSGDTTPGPCGPALPGCTADLCASTQPSQPLSHGPHVGHVFNSYLVDSGESVLDYDSVDVTVDPTPPRTSIYGSPDSHKPFKPAFHFITYDDNYLEHDHAQCSVTSLHASPHWRRCKLNRVSSAWSTHVSHKRHDYRFRVRAVDRFGRHDASPAHVDFNPVPCVVKAKRVSLSHLASHGLPVRVKCAFAGAVSVRFAYDNSTAFENTPIGSHIFTGNKHGHWKVHGKIKVRGRTKKSFVRHQKKLPIKVIAVPGHGIYSGAYGKTTTSDLRLHR